MYDGQLELEYTCVGCHENTYPKRLMSGYCYDCLFGGMTQEEIEAESREHEQRREDDTDRYLFSYARDVVGGKHTVETAARACYASREEMQEAVDDLRQQDADDEAAYQDYLTYCAAERRAAHIHRALRRGAAYARTR
ncbi:hypothetical protein [Deinococcus humi]|uniref:Uncharacterized protein n=1 Tax=Deinococcus humi TaxID=662880 RepID=A0A7W8JT86_9DEIO|nr:hypothetical protein [Deinococcus humi]MBB5361376.1 hypothetical protein [Deinococcus humi]GGO19764.1 hypothetical protein GCM10008949_04380 [Deinococcus humi]